MFQVISTVSGSLNNGNCSAAPNCTLLNRQPCTTIANTCGACFSGYLGILGSSNAACKLSSSFKNIGQSCSKSSDCISNHCVGGVCVSSNKACANNCSEAGSCVFYDPNGAVLQSCDSNSLYCQAKCTCFARRYGRDCSLNEASYLTELSLRSTMCNSYYNAAEYLVSAQLYPSKMF